MESPELETFQEKMDKLIATFEWVRQKIAEELGPLFQALLQAFTEFIEALCREWLYIKLTYVLPDTTALWLSKKWPKRLLPPIKWVLRF